MKKQSFVKRSIPFGVSASLFIVTIFSGLLLSFTANKKADDFLKQMGIAKTGADKKITESILGGYLNAYGVKNIKNIVTSNRTTIANDLLTYTKKHVAGSAFIALTLMPVSWILNPSVAGAVYVPLSLAVKCNVSLNEVT